MVNRIVPDQELLDQHPSIEPVLQFTTRDRNRIAIQGDLIGGWALGIPNILCLYGDDITVGDQPDSKKVHDIDSKQLMETAKIMKNFH